MLQLGLRGRNIITFNDSGEYPRSFFKTLRFSLKDFQNRWFALIINNAKANRIRKAIFRLICRFLG